jgi:hypothetical protein
MYTTERGKVRVGADDSRGTQDRVSEDRRLGFVQLAKELRSGRVGQQETERREWTVDEVLQSK